VYARLILDYVTEWQETVARFLNSFVVKQVFMEDAAVAFAR
jgi:hypothetical protein